MECDCGKTVSPDDNYMHARRVAADLNKRFSQKHSDVEDFTAFMDALGSSK
jgi:hypothetical protein